MREIKEFLGNRPNITKNVKSARPGTASNLFYISMRSSISLFPSLSHSHPNIRQKKKKPKKKIYFVCDGDARDDDFKNNNKKKKKIT